MAKFIKKRGRTSPAINTSALPDIIFMLLFFFMVVTVLRKSSLKVRTEIPRATELVKLRHKSLIQHIHIGAPIDKERGNAPVIQINDAFVRPDAVETAARMFRQNAPELQRGLVTTSLKVDKKVDMGIVSDVKISLRKASQLRISYAALPRDNE
ncbi:MAG: biopolymer transporter ExbD [Bacteroidota bacterium]